LEGKNGSHVAKERKELAVALFGGYFLHFREHHLAFWKREWEDKKEGT